VQQQWDTARRHLGRAATYDIDRDWLYEQYVDKHRSLETIVAECARTVIAGWRADRYNDRSIA